MQALIEYRGEQFEVQKCEHGYILHPQVFGILPVWKESSHFDFSMSFKLDDYKLSLNQMWVEADCAMPVINGVTPKYKTKEEQEGVIYEGLCIPIQYTGAILMAHTKVNDYGIVPEGQEMLPCFCYKVVYEYIFENGILITTIDHSRAMIRIRKNLDLGYRDWSKKRDRRCIYQFIKTSLVGDYKKTRSKKKQEEYMSQMRAVYKDNSGISLEINIDRS